MAATAVTSTPPAEARSDALVVFVTRRRKGWQVRSDAELPREALTTLKGLLSPLAEGLAPDTAVIVPSAGAVAADVVAFAAVDRIAAEPLRRAAGAATRALLGRSRVTLAAPSDKPALIAAVAAGARLGAYEFTGYRTDAKARRPAMRITVASPAARQRAVRTAVAEALTVVDGVIATRDLVNTPPADLTPDAFANAVRRAAGDTPVRVQVLDERKLARGGYGGLIGVGKGSAHPPRLVRMTYRPPRARAHLGLVGKGVTFDSGGLSLKPATAMITMKCDMAGAAAVAEATLVVARLGLPVRITAYLALAENMPSGTAQRPGDVLTTYSGTTVEVLNTDAEGRLIMADALARACEDSPDLLVDVATLTGAQVVALGAHVSAAMGDEDPRDRIVAAAGAAGEQMWPMPLPEELRPSLDSKIADIANIGERMGGMMTAALFLREFVADGTPWVHLDIAGPAFNEGAAHGYTPTGGTGAALRTIVQLAHDMANG
ncbi:MAG: hypothetical protein RLZ55_68 [Actinomycetota bacterium]